MTSSEPEISYLRLISRLVALARALAEMRMAQLRAAQAAAALQAAEYLHAMRVGRAPRAAGERSRIWTAAELASREFPSLQACRRHPRSLAQTWLAAAALAAVGRPDDAAAAGSEACAIAVATTSGRTLAELSRLFERLRPWQGRPAVLDFGAELAAALTQAP